MKNEKWNGGTVEWWNSGIVERWNGGTVEWWKSWFHDRKTRRPEDQKTNRPQVRITGFLKKLINLEGLSKWNPNAPDIRHTQYPHAATSAGDDQEDAW